MKVFDAMPTGDERISIADIAILSLIFAIGVGLVNPAGDFPLNDDWSFGLTVKHLLDTGHFHPVGWASMPLITNALWGALFCLVDGFSFNALRASTLVIAWLGMAGAYLLAVELRTGRLTATLVALTVAFNPIQFALSHTFMTDVPASTLMVFAALLFVRDLKNASTPLLIGATLLSIAAVLSRQLGLAVPLAFAIGAALKDGLALRKLPRAFAPVAVSLTTLLAFQHWMEVSGNLPAIYHAKTEGLLHKLQAPKALLVALAFNLYVTLLYLGLFTLPVLVALRTTPAIRRRALIAFFILLAGLKASALLGNGMFMPFSGNILDKSGIGPFALRDAFLTQTNTLPRLSKVFWGAVTLLSVAGAALLCSFAIGMVRECIPRAMGRQMSPRDAITTFLLAVPTIYAAPLLLAGLYDRYLIPLIPFLACAMAAHAANDPGRSAPSGLPGKMAALILIGSFIGFSVCATHDFMEGNRSRWAVLEDLTTRQGIPPREIDGGFEFNGLHFYDPAYTPDPAKSWWWVQNDTYLLGVGEEPGYRVIQAYTYPRWMPGAPGRILVMERLAR